MVKKTTLTCWAFILVAAVQASTMEAMAGAGSATADGTIKEEEASKSEKPQQQGTCSPGSSGDNSETCASGFGNDNTANSTSFHPSLDWVNPQLEWVRSMGGFVNSKVEVRVKSSDEDKNGFRTTSPYGLFVTKKIAKDEIILSIPKDCIILPAANDVQIADGLHCGTARSIIREMKLGQESSYAPYVNFLASLPHGQLPSAWSPKGRELLLDLLGEDLPPMDSVGWLENEWNVDCQGSLDDPLERQAAMLVVQKDWNGAMVPFLDIVNPRRAPWENTYHNAMEFGRQHQNPLPTTSSSRQKLSSDVVVKASRHIQAGEEIYTDYQENSPELLRDVGVVDPYPQKWSFGELDLSFFLDKKLPATSSSSTFPKVKQLDSAYDSNGLNLMWRSDPPSDEDTIDLLQNELNRLGAFKRQYLSSSSSSSYNIPEREWIAIADYHKALTVALNAALSRLVAVVENSRECLALDENCVPTADRYDTLEEEFDDSFIKTDTCDQQKELDHSHYNNLEDIRSQYQRIIFLEDPVTKDMCFSLDKIYQICTKYRPHYHEPSVHYTSRFLKKLSRVIFIGGGDSMLLHEVLKYPTLEFVVGLEIDQKVTRNSFKYFGTQPHWDNDKVQWWYGDAAKSLLMLPKEYFGTFDLVLVDLSETVMSNTVTKGLDIMSALSLLLKPDGVFLKNEMYFEGLSRLFKHTIQLHYYDVPLVCSQCLVLGSNKIDFINTELTDHKVETMHKPVVEVDRHFELVHDYSTNMEAERHCTEDDDDQVPNVQERSPGVVMILEVENAAASIATVDELKSAIVQAIKTQGMTLVSTKDMEAADENGGPVVVAVLKEGYIVARAYPENKYCAFDIHMWSSLEKQEGVKKALTNAIGSSSGSSSAFRVAAGGMFGVSTWKQDDASRGPKFTQDCSDFGEKKGDDVAMDSTVTSSIVEGTMGSLLLQKNNTAMVLCGKKGLDCPAFDALKTSEYLTDVIPVWTCPNIVVYDDNDVQSLFACEKETYSLLKDKNIGVVVVDPNAPLQIAQVVHQLVSSDVSRDDIFAEDVVVLGISMEQDVWNRNFVDYFRIYFDAEPGFKASVLFHNDQDMMEVSAFSSGDKHFITHLKEAVANIEQSTGLTSDIRHIGGVEYEMQYNFKPSQFFNATDYDRTAAYEQWHAQQPVGYHNIFQLEIDPQKMDRARSSTLSCETVGTLLQRALVGNELQAESAQFGDLGEGCVFVNVWAEGNVVVLFNGRDHVDLNLFTYEEDFAFAQKFVSSFSRSSILSVALRDEMPRGYGKVVNFKKELEPRHEPHWAFAMDN